MNTADPASEPATAQSISNEQVFDGIYRAGEKWKYRPWMYVPLLRAITKQAGLKPGATVFDAGCGQGWFSHQLHLLGFQVTGADVSPVGIQQADAMYGADVDFVCADLTIPYVGQRFDAVFARSFGPYGVKDFATRNDITDTLMTYVKPGGVLLFVHHSKPWNRVYTTWYHHTLDQVRQHFSSYRAETAFVLRFEMWLLGRAALRRWWTPIALQISRRLKIGGELIAIVRKPE